MNVMKKVCMLFLSILLAVSMSSCSAEQKAEKNALEVVKTYIEALEEFDTEKQQECMDPSLTSFSEGLVNSVGDLFGISGAYDMSNGAAGLLGSLSQQALDVEIEYNYKKLLESDLSENNGTITVQYELVVKNNESGEKAKQNISWTFYMVNKDSEWYIQHYDDPQAVLSKEEQKAKDEYNSVGTVVQGIHNGSNFSEDLAWIECEEDSERRYYCVDKSGTIVFELEPDYKPRSAYNRTSEIEESFFKNGTSLVVYKENTEEETWCIIDNTGKIVKRLVEGDTALEATMAADGNYIVTGYFESINGNERKYGLMNSKGEYLIPLSAEISEIRYRGSDVYLVRGYMGGIKESFYNAKVKKTISSADDYDIGAAIGCGVGTFTEGYGIFLSKIVEEDVSYQISSLSAVDGSTRKLFTPFNGKGDYEYGVLSNGLIYVEDTDYGATEKGFFDIKGNLIIDLSQYENVYGLGNYGMPYFIDGYCALKINGFCLFIDTKGNEIIEPFKINGEMTLSDGILRTPQENGVVFYDMQGNKLSGIDDSATSFSCERAKIETDDGIHYIDKTGKVIF